MGRRRALSSLNELEPRFDEYNLMLQLVLGMLSVTERVERALPEPEAAPLQAAAQPEPELELDSFSAMLLGVVSFRYELLRLIEEFAPALPPPETERSAASPAEPPLRTILR